MRQKKLLPVMTGCSLVELYLTVGLETSGDPQAEIEFVAIKREWSGLTFTASCYNDLCNEEMKNK